MLDFFETMNKSYSSEELKWRREVGEHNDYNAERKRCIYPEKYEKLELSDRCRYRTDGTLECIGQEWLLDPNKSADLALLPENYKMREGAIQEREKIRLKHETIEIRWEYVKNEYGGTVHRIDITKYNFGEYKDKIEKLKRDKRCSVQKDRKRIVCKMAPTPDFPVHRGILPASAYR